MSAPELAENGGAFAGHGPSAERQRGGIRALIQGRRLSYERLPMLEVVCDRLTQLLTTNLRNIASDNVQVSLRGLKSLRFGEIFSTLSGDGMYAVFRAEEWENYGLVALDPHLIYILIEVLLGGRPANASADLPRRRPTTIDRALIEPFVRSVLADLSRAFGPLCAVSFRFERLELIDRFVNIARATEGAVHASFRLELGERSGSLDVILPHVTLEPVRDVLLQQFMGEKFGRDTTWEQHLAKELCKAGVRLDVVIEEQTMALSEILSLKVGEQLILHRKSASSARLRCENRPIYEGAIGQSRGRMAFRIEGRVDGSEAPDDSVVRPGAELERMEDTNG